VPVHGVQFHPESIASEHGATILRNFLDLAARWLSEREASAQPLSA
jgi:anthranilate synthase component 2